MLLTIVHNNPNCLNLIFLCPNGEHVEEKHYYYYYADFPPPSHREVLNKELFEGLLKSPFKRSEMKKLFNHMVCVNCYNYVIDDEYKICITHSTKENI